MPAVAEHLRDLLVPTQQRLGALERLTRETDTERWARVCPAEGWPVALVCYHIARGFDRQASFIEGVTAGLGPHRYSWDETHDLNARIAGEHPLPTPEDVMATARAAIARVRRAVSDMEPADLAAIAFVNGPFQGDVGWLVRTLMPQHADGHLASIASTLAT